jgi:amino acid permease-like protein
VPAAGDIVNFVVLTAALSSLNAGLYSTGRILHHRDLPDPAVPVVKARHPAAAVVPALRHPVRQLRDAAVPGRRDRTNVLRELLESGGAGGDHPGARGRGWYAVRGRVLEMATERIGFTGN